MSDNLIEIVNNDILVQIEDNYYELEVNNLIVFDYEYSQNKPKINSVELVGNKSLQELGIASAADLATKEDKANKITSLTSAVTDIQYPSAKVVYESLLEKADINLSNLSQTGQNIIDLKANVDLSNLSLAGQNLFANKADVNLNNITDTAKVSVAHSSMPSNTAYEEFTLGASGATYTMPADGYLNLKANGSNIGSFVIENTNSPALYPRQVGGVLMGTGYWGAWMMPVRKNDVVKITYQLVPQYSSLTFYYATGSESEAQ